MRSISICLYSITIPRARHASSPHSILQMRIKREEMTYDGHWWFAWDSTCPMLLSWDRKLMMLWWISGSNMSSVKSIFRDPRKENIHSDWYFKEAKWYWSEASDYLHKSFLLVLPVRMRSGSLSGYWWLWYVLWSWPENGLNQYVFSLAIKITREQSSPCLPCI